MTRHVRPADHGADTLPVALPLPAGVTDGERPAPQRRLAIAALLTTLALVVLDSAIANVALPTIAQALQVTPAASVLVITAYQTALVMALLPCAALGESYGFRRVYLGGVALFTVASALCAAAPSLPWLVAARALQGLGGAGIMALGMAMLRLIVPPQRLPTAIGWNALVVALTSAAGPSLGAAILSVAHWPWLFAVNLPLGIAVLAIARALPRHTGTGRRLDGLSVVLNAAAFALVVIGTEILPSEPLAAVALLGGAALAMTLLVRREAPKAAPLFPLDLLRAPAFRVSVIASVLCFAAQIAAFVALPFYLQHTLGKDTLTTGLYLTPWPLTVAFAGPLAGRLVGRIPGAWLCVIGGTLLAAGLFVAAILPLHDAAWPIALCAMMCGVGFGLFNVPNNHNMYLSAPHERSGAAGGMQGTARLSGQTAGAVIMTLLFSLVGVDLAPRIGLGIGAALALAAGIVSILRTPPGSRPPA
ncbi:MAG: MFS transporter [Pseudomonadota bacterium]|jgi:DHA2 family multidrug resistance protein-like MFS transporter